MLVCRFRYLWVAAARAGPSVPEELAEVLADLAHWRRQVVVAEVVLAPISV